MNRLTVRFKIKIIIYFLKFNLLFDIPNDNIYVKCCSFPGGSEVKVSACIVGDLHLIPGSGRSPGEENGNPLQYSCLENPMDGGALWATVHGVAKSRTQLSDLYFLFRYLFSQDFLKPSISQCMFYVLVI